MNAYWFHTYVGENKIQIIPSGRGRILHQDGRHVLMPQGPCSTANTPCYIVSCPKLTGWLMAAVHTLHEILRRPDVRRPQRELCSCPKIGKKKKKVTNYTFCTFEHLSGNVSLGRKYYIKKFCWIYIHLHIFLEGILLRINMDTSKKNIGGGRWGSKGNGD